SVPFYHLFPYRSALLLPRPLFLAPGPPPVDPLYPQGPAPSGVSQVDPLLGTAPIEVAVGSGASQGAVSGGAASGGAKPGVAESEGAGSGGVLLRLEVLLVLRRDCLRSSYVSGLFGVHAFGVELPELEALELEALELEALAREALELEELELLTLEALCGRDRTSFPCFSSSAVLPSVVILRLILSCLFALLIAFLILVLLLSPARTLWHFVLPLFHYVFLCLVLLSPLFLPSLTLSLTALVLLVPLSLVSSPLLSAVVSALVPELLDFAVACRLDYATTLVAEFASASPSSVGGECALGTDVLEDKEEDLECLESAVPRFASMLLAPEGDPDAPDTPTPRSYAEAITGTYIEEVPPPGANIFDGMWNFRVKQKPGSPRAFKARYIARGFSQQQGVDYFHTFSPNPKMITLQGSLHEEIWLRRPPGFTGSFLAGTQWILGRPVYGLSQAPREWHDTLRTKVAALEFAPSTADPSLFLRTDTSLSPFYILVYVDDLVFATVNTDALTLVKLELQKRHTCTDQGEMRSYPGLQITRDRAQRTITLTQSHMVHQVLQRFGFQFSSPQPTPLSTSHSLSSPPLDESVEPSDSYPELVGCLMYLMTCTRPDLAYPLSLLARYVAPAAWPARLAYVATRANTADVFTKALPPGDHQRFSTVLGLVPTLPHLLTA
ncbi:unnamed protein product, partial [Closterium sp. NIES-53]